MKRRRNRGIKEHSGRGLTWGRWRWRRRKRRMREGGDSKAVRATGEREEGMPGGHSNISLPGHASSDSHFPSGKPTHRLVKLDVTGT